MVQFKLETPLSFVLSKTPVLEGYIEMTANGGIMLVAGDFKQNLKQSELNKLMAANVLKEKPLKAEEVVEEEEEEEVVTEEVKHKPSRASTRRTR